MDYVLEIVEGPETGRQIPLTGLVEIGRDSGAGVPFLQDELVSRRHARLTPEADGVRVEDLGSRNGTFVNGDQIFSPAHLAIDGQLVIGVTVLQLRTAEAVRRRTAVRPIPANLTTLRSAPGLAVPESEPDYVPAAALGEVTEGGAGALLSLLDVHTKSKARGAPIGLFVLAALAVILYLALR